MVDGQFNYSICENGNCFGLPDNCLTTLDCQAICKVDKISSDLYQFEVQTIPQTNETTSPLAYVAVGLSLDSLMDEDSVVECVTTNEQIEVFMSYTRRSPRGADRHTVRFWGFLLIFECFLVSAMSNSFCKSNQNS